MVQKLTDVVCVPPSARPLATKARSWTGFARVFRSGWTFARFRRDEDGSLVVFSLFMFLIMVSLGALGVDFMRAEMERAKLQSTLDRAVLAAADMDQKRPPLVVVYDYFWKSGQLAAVTDVRPLEGPGFRSVSAKASTEIDTQLIHMFGFDTLTVPAAGAAEDSVGSVEISLVVDISRSMTVNVAAVSKTKLQLMQEASIDFVRAIFASSAANGASLSLVPFTRQVNIGPDLIDKYNITHRHNNSFCVDLPPSTYTSAALSRSLPMPQHAFADTLSFTWPQNIYQANDLTPSRFLCSADPATRVRVHSGSATDLETAINGLTAPSTTIWEPAIDVGLRWGAALLDPSARGVVDALVNEGVVSAPFRGRPVDYAGGKNTKVLVLVSPAEIFQTDFVNEDFKSGLSPIWRNSTDGRYSIYHPSAPGDAKYWEPINGTFYHNMWGGWYQWNCSTNPCTRDVVNGTAVQLTWEQVWQQLRVQWVANQLYARPFRSNFINIEGAFNHYFNVLRTVENATAMNARFLTLCNDVKAQGVVIYTIALDAPPAGRTLLSNCASSINHAFDVTGPQLSGAFSSIATSIRQLRLTQ